MSAVQDIEAAIDRLTELRRNGSSGGDPWSLSGSRVTFEDGGKRFAVVEQANWGAPADMEIIPVLYATIDAQLVILRDAWKVLTDAAWMADYGEFVEPAFRQPLLIARAILGGIA